MSTKQILLSILLSFLFSVSYCQQEEVPKTYFELGLGVGQNHGLVGGKFLLGYKGNGLIIGAGVNQGIFMRQLGFQFTYKWVFMNMGTGAIGSYKVGNTSEIKRADGIFFIGGIRKSVNKPNTIFLEIGLGSTSKKNFVNAKGERDSVGGLTGVFGVGFKIG